MGCRIRLCEKMRRGRRRNLCAPSPQARVQTGSEGLTAIVQEKLSPVGPSGKLNRGTISIDINRFPTHFDDKPNHSLTA